MPDTEALDRTRDDYDAVAEAYDEMIRTRVLDPLSPAMIDAFAGFVAQDSAGGTVWDVGCGPGHWSDHLDRRRLDVRGIDLSPAMIAIARRYRPDLSFEVGSLLQLPAADASAQGILAHFSLIHLQPALVPAAFGEFARVLAPGGHVLVAGLACDGTGPWAPYDHRASPAFAWNLDALAAELVRAGFVELARLRVAPPPEKIVPAGYLLARRKRERTG